MLFDIWLTLLPYIGPVKARYLLKQFGNAKTVYNVEPAEIEEMRVLSLRQKKSLIENKSLNKAEQILQKCRKYNISVLTIENPLYPDRAKMIKDAPTVIYYKGTIKKMEKTVGKQSIRFEEAIHLISAASIAGKKEGEGPLGKLFDKISADRRSEKM